MRGCGWNTTSKRAIWGVAGVCGVVLLYRTWFLGGIGGYRNVDGTAIVTIFHPLLTLKALFFRSPAIFFFPLDWLTPLGPMAKIALAAMLISLAAIALVARSSRRSIFCSLAILVLASIPVQHLLLIGPGLTGACNVSSRSRVCAFVRSVSKRLDARVSARGLSMRLSGV